MLGVTLNDGVGLLGSLSVCLPGIVGVEEKHFVTLYSLHCSRRNGKEEEFGVFEV